MNVGYLVEATTTIVKRMHGGQLSFVTLLTHLKKLGVVPFVVVSEEWELTDKLQEAGICCLITPIYAFFDPIRGSYCGSYHRYNSLHVKREQNRMSKQLIIKYFQDNHVQIIHINSRLCSLIGAEIAQELSLPYIYHVREFLEDDFGLQFKDQSLACKYISESNLVIAVSDSVKASLVIQYPNAHIKTIYNGVDSSSYYIPLESRLVSSAPRLMISGRIIDHKCQLDAVKAVKLLLSDGYEVNLDILGHRPDEMSAYEAKLCDFIRDNHLQNHVRLINYSSDVLPYYNECDIGIICSAKEAFGRVTVEYMMAGMLAIGSDTGGTPEIIEHGKTGLLYCQGDYRQLADQIKWAFSNREQVLEIVRNGQNAALQNFESSNNALKIYYEYNEILAD